MKADPKQIVARGYDQMADRFAGWQQGVVGSPHMEWVEELLSLLPPKPAALELGCGAATEPTQALARRGRLLGVDISAEQLRRARERCPGARFIHEDMSKVELDAESFDAVVSLYVFNHLPRLDLPPLLGRIAGWLRPDGYLLATFGISGAEGIQEEWLGVPMFFASYTEQENLVLLRESRLEPVRHEVVAIQEPEEGEARFQWLLARKPGP